MVNIILESSIADKVDVVYSTPKNYQNQKKRFAKADIVFLSTLGLNKEIIDDVHRRCSANTKFFIIGEKTLVRVMDKFIAIVILQIIIS